MRKREASARRHELLSAAHTGISLSLGSEIGGKEGGNGRGGGKGREKRGGWGVSGRVNRGCPAHGMVIRF